MAPIDQVHLSFNPQTLTLLNAVLGLVMFGVALELRVEDFKVALRTPKALALGLFGHHILFPAMTYGLIWILKPEPSIALGMILVSACPAGHISNFMVHLSKGNTALSVSVSALSTVVALFMTPLNFAFWGNLHPITAGLMKQVAMSPWEMLEVIVMLLGVPLVLGMWVAVTDYFAGLYRGRTGCQFPELHDLHPAGGGRGVCSQPDGAGHGLWPVHADWPDRAGPPRHHV
jgi:BASS family bile acid:Na+ symporter